MSKAIAFGLCLAMAGLGACSSAPRGAKAGPDWFKDSVRQSKEAPYPSLNDVPIASALLRPPGQWDGLELDLAKDHQVLAASPRAEGVPEGAASAGAQFEAEARAALAAPTPRP